MLLLTEDAELIDFCSHTLQKTWNIDFFDTVVTPHLILIDFSLIEKQGFSFLKDIVLKYKTSPVLVTTKQPFYAFAVQSIKMGACDYFAFPCSADFFLRKIETYVNFYETCLPNETEDFAELITASQYMGNLKKQLSILAKTDYPILLLGESGTGKSLIAKLIHQISGRNKNSFFEINISALHETLAASELFGTTNGAFTGAVLKQGFFEKSHRGTLFLDEIGDLPPPVQVMLLKVLETGLFYKLGSTQPQKTDVRLIFATNVQLSNSVEQKTFREDLFYRISLFPVNIPPLRERKEDIEILAHYFLKKHHKTCSKQCIQKLQAHKWEGNVRELQNCLIRSAILCHSKILTPSDILFF